MFMPGGSVIVPGAEMVGLGREVMVVSESWKGKDGAVLVCRLNGGVRGPSLLGPPFLQMLEIRVWKLSG